MLYAEGQQPGRHIRREPRRHLKPGTILVAGRTMKRFSVAEAAKELGVSTGTVYGLCASRKLRHERHGLGRGRIKIPDDALQEYRRSVTVGTERAASLPPTAR